MLFTCGRIFVERSAKRQDRPGNWMTCVFILSFNRPSSFQQIALQTRKLLVHQLANQVGVYWHPTN